MPLLDRMPTRPRMRAAGPAVLIADSDEATCDVVRRYLLLRGYEVETAAGGVECLTKLGRRADRVVLVLDLDLFWGGGDGVLAVMRENPALADVPTVLTSARGPAGVGPGPDLPQVLCVLEKPFALDALADTIRSAAVRAALARSGHGRPGSRRRRTGGRS